MNTNSDLVTVIIPAYNHEKYVQETLNSIIKQTYDNLELIVIDDGSTDATWKKIKEMEKACKQRVKRLILKRQDNSGLVAVLNKALSKAEGKYIYCIASDDIAHPEAIEKLHANIGDAALIFPDLALIDETGQRFYLTERDWSKTTYDINNSRYKTYQEAFINEVFPDMDQPNFDWYKNLLRACCINISFLVSRDALIRINAYSDKESLIEDYSMYLQLAKFYKIKRLREVLFYYRRHSGNLSANDEFMNTGVYRIFIKEKDYCYKNGYRTDWDELFLNRFYNALPRIRKLMFRISAYIHKKFSV